MNPPNKLSSRVAAGLAKIGGTVSCPKSKIIYSQGTTGREIFYIEKGMVMLTVETALRPLAVVAVLSAGDFFDELCLLRPCEHRSTATAVIDCSMIAIPIEKLKTLISRDKEVSRFFQSWLLSSITRYREDRVDLLINGCKKRLAGTLLRLAHSSPNGGRASRIPRLSQHVLAEMIGTTRSRINFFMEEFRKKGHIRYKGGIQINKSLQNVLREK